MSISDTEAKARAAGMTYGQYCDARDRGMLPDETTTPASSAPSPVPGAHPVQQKIRWTVELKNDLRRLYEEGLSIDEIGEQLGIDPAKIKTQLGHMKYREGYVPPTQAVKKSPSKKKTARQTKPEKVKSIAEVCEKNPSIYDSTDPMCVLEFLKRIVTGAFNADEITAVYAVREDSIAEIQYRINDDIWTIQVRKE